MLNLPDDSMVEATILSGFFLFLLFLFQKVFC